MRLPAEHNWNLNREIYLISDFQANSFNPDIPLDDFDGKTFLVDLPIEEIDNSGILDVDPGNQLIEVGTSFTITTTIKKMSGAADYEILVSVYLDDSRIAQDGLRLKPGESGTVAFELIVNNPGLRRKCGNLIKPAAKSTAKIHQKITSPTELKSNFAFWAP